MQHPNQSSRNFLNIIPVALISLLIVRLELRTERCFGLVDGVLNLVLWGALCISFFISIVAQFIKIKQKQQVKSSILTVFLIVFCTLLAIWAIYIPNDFFENEPILEATLEEPKEIGILILRERGKYTARFGHIDWSCIKTGNYRIVKDTLFLEKGLLEETNNIIAFAYVRKGSRLLPINEQGNVIGSQFILQIRKHKIKTWE